MELELPKIKKVEEMTHEQMMDYVRFVSVLRHNQNRWFRFKDPSALNLSKQMEKDLDAWNNRLLNPVPSLFD